eukprot:2402055-Rhodomonas_salina.1
MTLFAHTRGTDKNERNSRLAYGWGQAKGREEGTGREMPSVNCWDPTPPTTLTVYNNNNFDVFLSVSE